MERWNVAVGIAGVPVAEVDNSVGSRVDGKGRIDGKGRAQAGSWDEGELSNCVAERKEVDTSCLHVCWIAVVIGCEDWALSYCI